MRCEKDGLPGPPLFLDQFLDEPRVHRVEPGSRLIKKEQFGFVQEVLAEMKRADFLFTSLGCLKVDPAYEKLAPRPHRYMLENLKLTEAALLKEGAVGDINYSFFAEDGTTAPEWNIFPALGVAQAQSMVKAQKTVVVAAGRYKTAALRAALRGRLFNVLITDELAAKELLGGD